jgi:hypothetical protein
MRLQISNVFKFKRMRDAAGITTAAPRVADQLGQGKTGCQNDAGDTKTFRQLAEIFTHG